MTSSSEQPPNEQLPEYIINYNDVLAIRGFMIRAGYPEEQINAFEEQITAKLGEGHDSRPHPAPDRYIDESTETPCTPEGVALIAESAKRSKHPAPAERLGFTEFCHVHCDKHECCTNECERSAYEAARKASEGVLKVLEDFADIEFQQGTNEIKEVNKKTRDGTWDQSLNPDIHHGFGQGRATTAGAFKIKIKSLRTTPQHEQEHPR